MINLYIIFFLLVKSVLGTYRPIIGILAQEIEATDPNRVLNFTSYLASSYVKAVEASGARVVPVFINREPSYYEDIANKVNGFVYTGGSSNIMSRNGVARSGKLILDEVLKKHASGETLPILAVCQGMELLAVLTNGWQPVLTGCQVENEALPLKMLPGFRNSSLYRDASYDDMYTLTHTPSTSNHHGKCLTQKNITKYDLSQWRVLSTSISKGGFNFVSTMEWHNVSIAAVQFHPEKSAYEWKPGQTNPHDGKSIRAARLFYDWLVAKARLNNNAFDNSQEEQEALIYNYCPIYTGKQGGYDTQNYYFYDPSGILENSLDK